MTDDPHRDPTRTEDVEERVEHDDVLEALKWFRRKTERAPVGGVPMPDRMIEEREQVVTRYLSQKEETIRELRQRLEEAVEERDEWESDWREADRRRRAARRRADRLEEAVREADERLFNAESGDANDEAQTIAELRQALADARQTLRSALDSREDEGEGVPRKRPTIRDEPHRMLADDDTPVHADEPEGETTKIGENVYSTLFEPEGGDDDGGNEAPRRAVPEKEPGTGRAGDTTRGGEQEVTAPTDEPVSREGVYDEVRAERRRQDEEWGPPEKRTHLSATDLSAIVAEEAGELAEAALESDFAGSQSSEKGLDLRQEAIQVAARWTTVRRPPTPTPGAR